MLTLHQGLPSGGTAIFTVSVETHNATTSNDELIGLLTMVKGVLEARFLAASSPFPKGEALRAAIWDI